MKALALIFALILLPFIAAAERVALVIGNSVYQSVPELSNPQNDSGRVSEALIAQGFDVTIQNNLDLNTMRRALKSFRKEADRADLAVVFYAGHGIEIGGVNYLVPVDAILEDERDANIELFPVDDILTQISGARRMKMVVLDACRNNPFVTKMKQANSGRSVSRGLGNIEVADTDTLIAYAAAAGEVTPDGAEGQNSPFTRAFVNALAGPPTDVRRLLGIVRDEMRQTVPSAAPFVYSSLGGAEYVINPQSVTAAEEPVAEAPADSAPADTERPFDENSIFIDFAKAEMGGTVGGWNGFLTKYDAYQTHPIYATALGKKGLLERQITRNSTAKPAQPVPKKPATAAPPPVANNTQIATNGAESASLAAPEPGAPTGFLPVSPRLTQDQAARSIQAFLKERKCYSGKIDGLIGRGSTSGLSRFSTAAGTTVLSVKIGRHSLVDDLNTALSELYAAPQVNCAATTTARSSYRPKPEKSNPTTTSKQKKRSWGCSGQNDAYYCNDDD